MLANISCVLMPFSRKFVPHIYLYFGRGVSYSKAMAARFTIFILSETKILFSYSTLAIIYFSPSILTKS